MSYQILNPVQLTATGSVEWRFEGVRHYIDVCPMNPETDSDIMKSGFNFWACKSFQNMYRRTADGIQYDPCYPVIAVKLSKSVMYFPGEDEMPTERVLLAKNYSMVNAKS
jgi:hypothetical protein